VPQWFFGLYCARWSAWYLPTKYLLTLISSSSCLSPHSDVPRKSSTLLYAMIYLTIAMLMQMELIRDYACDDQLNRKYHSRAIPSKPFSNSHRILRPTGTIQFSPCMLLIWSASYSIIIIIDRYYCTSIVNSVKIIILGVPIQLLPAGCCFLQEKV